MARTSKTSSSAKTTARQAKPAIEEHGGKTKPGIDLTMDAFDMNLMKDRYFCLANVAGFLESSDQNAINLLHDLCNEMLPMTLDQYGSSINMGIKILRRFAADHDLVLVQEAEEPEECRPPRYHKLKPESKIPLAADEFATADNNERIFLGQCLRLHRNNINNAVTPLESFLIDEVFWYDTGYRLTPDEMVDRINSPDHFRGYFNDAIKTAEVVLSNYKDLVKEVA